MRNEAHTQIGIIRLHVEAWRKANGWSRETAAMVMVEAHERIGGPATTGIVFDPPTQDAFARAKVNAERIFRWLDDVTKDNNLLPFNFWPAIQEALPMDRRMSLVNELLRPAHLACRALPVKDDGDTTVMLFKRVVATSSTANMAMADLLDGIAPGELEHAQAAIGEAQRQNAAALVKVEAKLEGGQ